MRADLDPPITLGLRFDDPEPPLGCGVCTALAGQRAEAAAGGDMSRVFDLNVEIRNHHQMRLLRRRQ
ncbi:hypothetical protein OG864_02005 [Streptomyces sp. NBC_00124]|uniref:hypothetical protein n=1 Tax=Streptomyces sp. NBC_00124 TaxID=2975662 RepID=UPI00224FD5A1|nr:hypothetical protein [Streptomyces sp. NBC_00124]MCX5357531.1 hypothetical protein [Streptomyces sp. NBC_00124]